MREYEGVNLSRRSFLKLAAVSLLGVACGPMEDQESHQTGLEFKNAKNKIWTAPYWYPLSESIARKINVPVLHLENGPLHNFDKIFRNITGRQSDARGWARDFAQESLKRNPDWENWMGYCHGLANAQALEKKPLTEMRQVAGVSVNKVDTVGILAALHASDAALRYSEDKSDIQGLIEYFIQTGNPVVVNIPDGQDGRWFRTVYSATINGRFVKTTDLNKGEKTFLTSSVKSAHIPYHGQDADSRYQAFSINWRNPYLEGELQAKIIRHAVYGEKL